MGVKRDGLVRHQDPRHGLRVGCGNPLSLVERREFVAFTLGIFADFVSFNGGFVLDEFSSSWARTETSSPAAIENAPTSRPATPARRTVPGPGFAPATPKISEMFVRSPSPARAPQRAPHCPARSGAGSRYTYQPRTVARSFQRPSRSPLRSRAARRPGPTSTKCLSCACSEIRRPRTGRGTREASTSTRRRPRKPRDTEAIGLE